jgi:hypothetical protein
MTLGLKKCATAHVVAGKVVLGGRIPLATGGAISEVLYGETYRMSLLLGVWRVRAEFFKRLRKTWRSQLNSKNKVRASNTMAVVIL